jgi:CRISPR-associated exonuclease Cas4
LEGLWNENYLTAKGRIVHERVHNMNNLEWIDDKLVSRGLRLQSESLGLYGVADAVEFSESDKEGIILKGKTGIFSVMPVEYKKGKPKISECDRLQMCAQAICLEEMTGSSINEGAIYYHDIRHREYVELNSILREKLFAITEEMHNDFEKRVEHIPRYLNHCKACSLYELCQPRIKYGSASKYLLKAVEDSIRENE